MATRQVLGFPRARLTLIPHSRNLIPPVQRQHRPAFAPQAYQSTRWASQQPTDIHQRAGREKYRNPLRLISRQGWIIIALSAIVIIVLKDSKKEELSLVKPTYASHKEMLEAAKEIAQILGQDAVTYDTHVLEHHGHSDCARNVPMVPFGAGSSVEGNFSQPYSGICIDFTYMDKVVAFHPDDMDVVVQAGVNWVDLNNQIAHTGLFVPLDPSPTATVGGMVSTNCSGTNAMRYGTMKDWVLNLTVVLPDGRIIKTRRRPRKTSAGYNLTSLFVGAEGTLGMVTEVTLKLAPIPKETSVAVVAFPTIHSAAAAASKLIRSGIQLAALELMDDEQMKLLNTHGSDAVRKRVWDEKPTLFLKFSGTTKDAIKSDVSRVAEIVKPLTDSKFHFAKTKQDELDLWSARKEALFTMVNTRPKGTEIWSTDVAVPISRLAEIIEISKRECGSLGLFASVIGHVGDGNFHVSMMYDPTNLQQKQAVAKCVKNMMTRALEMEGTHAIGIGKKECLVDELGEETIGLMRQLKASVDPKWVMNPGKVFDWMGY
ncbi:FAD-linked oxidase-like protein [Neurospora tetraspora]|uniref:D-lactate dehydrogenase (cytochrome) n=1 Tax=Neurospora tetraspora TaxID=94610 RepID=A0AAE0MTH3_9PEZI|nr:FAD-linked oxidase-like protein [Neurospora tetraspora]